MNKFHQSKITRFLLSVFLVSMFSFPNSFGSYKLILLSIILGLIFIALLKKDIIIKSLDAVYFYIVFSLLSVTWILWGALNNNPEKALNDTFKLYVIYSFIYCILILAFQDGKHLGLMLRSFLISAWIIVLTNLISLSEILFGFQVFSNQIREEMGIDVGIHAGYTDVSANNINSLFYIIPIVYIMAIAKKPSFNYSKFMMWSLLLLSILVSLISGRRALIILLLSIPFLFEIQKRIVLINTNIEVIALRRLPVVILFVIPFAFAWFLYFMNIIDITSLVEKFSSAFQSDTVRVDQYNSLLKGFSEKYLFGSGLGGSVEVIRNQEKPWTYELTYMLLLFNGGLVGFSLVFTLFGFYYFKSLLAIRRFDGYKTEALAILTGFLIFCIASASNPYFSSFDSVFILGTLPLLSGWHAYFKKTTSNLTASVKTISHTY